MSGWPAVAQTYMHPDKVAAYLRAKGWRPVGATNVKEMWMLPIRGEVIDVILPLDRGLADYGLRMEEVLTTLASAEGRPQFDILQDVLDGR